MQLRRRRIAKARAVVFLVNLAVMSAGAFHSYQHAPPIPKCVVAPDGETILTESDIHAGKAAFQ